MNRIVKQLLILVLIFLIILWVQSMDDKTKNKKRNNIYDKIKVPLLVSSIVGLLFNINLSNFIDSKVDSEIIIIKPKCNSDIVKQDVYLDLNY